MKKKISKSKQFKSFFLLFSSSIASIIALVSCQNTANDQAAVEEKNFYLKHNEIIKTTKENKNFQEQKAVIFNVNSDMDFSNALSKSFKHVFSVIEGEATPSLRIENIEDTNIEATFFRMFNDYIDQGFNIFAFNSPKLVSSFSLWLTAPNNQETLKEKNIKILTFDASKQLSKIGNNDSLISFNFLPEDVNWIAGYFASSYLAQNYKEEKQRKILIFNNNRDDEHQMNKTLGFLAGILSWNKNNPNLKVKVDQNSDDIAFINNDEDKIRTFLSNPNNKEAKILFVATNSLIPLVYKYSDKANQKLIVNNFKNNEIKPSDINPFLIINEDLKLLFYKLIYDLYTKKVGTNDSLLLRNGDKNIIFYVSYKDKFYSFSSKFNPANQKLFNEALNKYKDIVRDNFPNSSRYLLDTKQVASEEISNSLSRLLTDIHTIK
ncbi:sugar ABC transporter substrate-binding protein [Mycoplasma sp. 1654_15]|uniref:sugar ABC transporter substrate-binding protein n=1 Tax=Mycoplasma sp. 1654_15 TaxID=2725994 RepID=UPI001449888A|nr:sugar ABC transporter substrate-binding protein [Mycoplasma sp. 1654_15]QJB71119.1 sugar ABC transporter substrate-binding protein [Mycoplasma sp. 1654_15]